MKIYTKTGDDGMTGLYGGPRVRKDVARIEAYGTVDELNSILGLVRANSLPPEVDQLLARVQNELFNLGAELATPDPHRLGEMRLNPKQVVALESAIDRHEADLDPLRQFILPGGVRGAAELHLARTVCRRAERRLVTLADAEGLESLLIVYLNRLSDLLFVLARWLNRQAHTPDVPWQAASPE